ncbi:MAG: hypothetical protein U0637_00095 [Phycisphaerales bacterium]
MSRTGTPSDRRGGGVAVCGVPAGATARGHGLVVLAVSVVCSFAFLGRTGFFAGEGAGVYPGWEMLERDDWVVPRLFGLTDLRSGVLVAWLQGASAWVFGESEFVARGVVGAAFVCICVASFVFGQRWFGRPWGLVAGLAACVMPVWWWEGRWADPAVVHALFVMLAACLMMDRVLGPVRTGLGGVGAVWGLALCVACALLAAGPAGMPVLMATLVAILVVTRSVLAALWPGTLLMLGAGTLAWATWVMAVRSALVHESVPELAAVVLGGAWGPDLQPLLRALAWAPLLVCLAWAPWGGLAPGLRRLRWSRGGWASADAVAAALPWVCVLGLAGLWAVGAGSLLPALVLLPLCVAGVACHRLGMARRVGLPVVRRARAVGVAAFAFLLVAGAALTLLSERSRESPRGDAERLGEVLVGKRADHRELWAEGVAADAPEVLRYACDRAYERGQFITARWKFRRAGDPANLPPEGSYLVVKTDERRRAANRDEWPDFEAAGVSRWPVVFDGTTHNWRYRVFLSPTP